MTIEDIVLQNDRRGISDLRPFLAKDFCHEAARYILEHRGKALIATGFYVPSARVPETDGPPGAVALGNALQILGMEVAYVSDEISLPLLQGLAGPGTLVLDFPIMDHERSRQFASEMLAKHKPSFLVSVERLSFNEQRLYQNMRGFDITPYNAKLDYLFMEHPYTIGVGDGGNEIGMGKLASVIPQLPRLRQAPAVTPTNNLVIATVSNWGCYGIAGALSLLTERRVCPAPEDESRRIEATARLGAVDGMSHVSEAKVDGFDLQENSHILEQLNKLLWEAGID